MKFLQLDLSPSPLILVLAGLLLGTVSNFAMTQDRTVEEEEAMLEEVVVTARKMKENIQEVPVAITAIGADMIDRLNIIDLTDIS